MQTLRSTQKDDHNQLLSEGSVGAIFFWRIKDSAADSLP
jgi:hypothetical protein